MNKTTQAMMNLALSYMQHHMTDDQIIFHLEAAYPNVPVDDRGSALAYVRRSYNASLDAMQPGRTFFNQVPGYRNYQGQIRVRLLVSGPGPKGNVTGVIDVVGPANMDITATMEYGWEYLDYLINRYAEEPDHKYKNKLPKGDAVQIIAVMPEEVAWSKSESTIYEAF